MDKFMMQPSSLGVFSCRRFVLICCESETALVSIVARIREYGCGINESVCADQTLAQKLSLIHISEPTRPY